MVVAGSLIMAGGTVAAKEDRVPTNQAEITLTFAPLVKKAAPAVVNIFTKKTVEAKSRSLFRDPFFERFFGPGFGKQRNQKRTQNSLGSGVIINADGTIVTNYHVVNGADEITVALHDRREFDASVVLEDERTDLAVLKINTEGDPLPFLEFNDSDTLEVGDLVIAIGNPFGVGQTVTSGIVSALDRNAGVGNDIRSFIQTDAAINPGNSGGALLTMDGRLAGVNSAIFSKGGGSLGIGFAIPANLVRSVLANGLANGEVIRPWLGASGQRVTRDAAESLGLDRPGGVLVNSIYPGGAAAKGGLKVGDVVTSVDGKEVLAPEALLYRVSTGEIGKTTALGIYRNGQHIEVNVPLQKAPEDPPRDLVTLGGPQPLAGAEVGNLSPALALEIGFPALAKGIVVTGVEKDSLAERYGIRRGDIMLAVNGKKAANTRDLQRLLVAAKGRWTIQMARNGRVLTFQVSR
ncbi:serine protease [Sneathiella chinensis]|uniref:Serine protease n=1 Tax=Sneathiella chinensis TaxID=349750 RepID=A0ABQ5U7I4_9PROT|nr:serine protease [Sneathiella chinensis]